MKAFIFEYNKLKKSNILFMFFVGMLIFVMYAQYDAMLVGIDLPGYMVSVGLAMMNVIGIYFSIISGAMIFYNDMRWNTYQVILIDSKTRRQVVFNKILTILLINAFLLFTMLLFTGTVHYLMNGDIGNAFPQKLLWQFGITYLNLSFWSFFAFTLTALTRSIVIGILFPFAVINCENILYSSLDKKILCLFPNYNIKSFLYLAFDNLKPGSMIIFQDTGYYYGIFSYIYISILVFVFIILSAFVYERMDVSS